MSEKKVTLPEGLVKQARELLREEHTKRVHLEKVAAENILEKRAQKVAFLEVELGISEPFKSLKDYQEKIASLVHDDLDVIEKALERGYGISGKSGELVGANANTKGMNVLERYITTGELE